LTTSTTRQQSPTVRIWYTTEDNQHHKTTEPYCPYLVHHGGQPAPQDNRALLSVFGTPRRTTSTKRQHSPTVCIWYTTEDNQHKTTEPYSLYLVHHGGQPAPQDNRALLSVFGTPRRTTSTTRQQSPTVCIWYTTEDNQHPSQQYPTVRKVLTSGVNVGTGVGTCGSSPDLKVMSRDLKHK